MKELFLFCALAGSLAVDAQSKLPSHMRFTRLPNGLELLVVEDHSVPLVTVEIAVKNGSYTESPEYNGLSHLYEHMFFKANKYIPSQEKYLERIRELGISFNGTTNTEKVNYFFTLGSSEVNEGLEFFKQCDPLSAVSRAGDEKREPVVDGEFQRYESDPLFPLWDKFDRVMWGENFSRKNVIGNHDVILTATTEKMNVIKDKYYYPNNSVLVVAGDVQYDDILKKVTAIFSDWKASDFNPFEKWPIPEQKKLQEADSLNFLVVGVNARVPSVQIGWIGPDTRNDVKNTYVADVFSYIVTQKNSKFQKSMVETGYALDLNLSYLTQKYAGPISITMTPNPQKFNESLKMLQKQIDQFDSEDYFTDEQLATAKIKLANGDKYNSEVTSRYVSTLTFWWSSASLDYHFAYTDEINKVTREDIQNYVREYIKGKPSVRGLMVTAEEQKEWKITDVAALFKY